MKNRMTVQEWRETGGKLATYTRNQDGSFTARITPMGKPRMTQRDKWDKRACVVRYREMSDRLRNVCTKAGIEVGGSLFVEFVLPMPKSWSKKKKDAFLGTPHDQKPDIDNMCKSVLDTLCKEDKGVHTCFSRKYWGENGKPGSITIYPNEETFLSAAKK